MCGHCGCGAKAGATVINLQTGHEASLGGGETGEHLHDHFHVHADGVAHAHSHDHDPAHVHSHAGHGHDHHHHDHHDHGHHGRRHSHDHAHEHGHTNHDEAAGLVLDLEARILAKNDVLAARNRAWFAGREILALNLASSPGAGKTTLLERTIGDLHHEVNLFVIEGDQVTANDGERIRRAGAPAVQVNTGTGCHLEADMIARALSELRPPPESIVMIENVGNLVCPAMFDLGEHARVVILSVTEGEDKPIKYPHMFRSADLMILNKLDLLPHVDFDVDRAVAYARDVNPAIEVLQVSARNGAGFEEWYGWIRRQSKLLKDTVFPS
ncbi:MULTISPECIES: hydrogenase nickel incorporation protein HypB [unclassified Bradyrhizobium]|uniref:Hydrogenase maturation factor HypB n=3 Tax=Bradyrhizobium TaxID=374 RepID=A0AAE5X912_9BRAD|nr:MULTISPECIES: hydrogenase nickel incorporation protein HypB [Bradyrhizobium]MCG2628112.1 hydrogenase nickel incorporation protein HypB [Bradyrhizobium zhengyangense]MCG2643231.1 hydrogenase nickel incorporation protein HypB [Bradyrhizobium zhengyangense]MCG2670455.1 hydrogenase nickel incorporation protein HypB [Bradyrhizobium zhengyangense]MDN4985810.1 hydrogenase nickel incorporation protein HypB [Bradyrhizobium sp. WYCCWR 13022]QAU43506.1 hydrogenase accessory protein HypB [Bradyrhizobiu